MRGICWGGEKASATREGPSSLWIEDIDEVGGCLDDWILLEKTVNAPLHGGFFRKKPYSETVTRAEAWKDEHSQQK